MNFHAYPHPSQRRVTFGAKGMVATSQQLCAQAGLDILKQGGNAIDAAIATAACLTVVEPCSNGIGGDAFAQVWTKDGLFGLNATGACPAMLTAQTIRDAGHKAMPKLGFCPQTVPGLPAAWAALSERFGSLPLTETLAPAIRYAADGFTVGPTVAERWKAAAEETYAPHRDRPEFAEWFRVFTNNGKAPQAGECWRLPDHAQTLADIASTAAKSFYQGALADEIDRYMRAAGGYLRKNDLAAFEPEWVTPLTTAYRGYDIWELPPNGQGLIALMALNILNGMALPSPEDPKSWHLQIEALKLAATDAYHYIADPRIGMAVTPQQLLGAAYAERRRALISDEALLPTIGNPTDGGTVYLCTADADGNMVSYIQSNYNGFGSGVVIPGTGIALHNRGGGFYLDENSPNCIAPGKRPYHTIIPGFISKNGQPVAPFGVMGAFMQPQGHLQVVLSLLEYHKNPQSALDAPRWHWTGARNVSLEHGVPLHIARALEQMGHQISYSHDRAPFGRGQIIWRQQNGVYAGGTDPRCDGAVVAQ